MPAIERILAQLPAAQKYFLDFLPHKKEYEKTLPKNKQYIRIQNLLKNENTLKIQMCFLKSIGPIYTDFLTILQQIGPLFHMLFKHVKEMLKKYICRFIKAEEIKDKKASDLVVLNVKDATNQLELKDIEVGEETEMLLKELNSLAAAKECKKMLNFYIAAAQYLQKKLPLDSQNLKDLVALHPQSRQAKFIFKAITQLARQLPHVIKGDEIASLRDEWKAVQGEPILSNWYKTGKFSLMFLCFLFLTLII